MKSYTKRRERHVCFGRPHLLLVVWAVTALGVGATGARAQATAESRQAVAPAQGKTLRLGDAGPAVEDLQRRLNHASLDPPPSLDVDGDFGPATRAAVLQFQRSRGLPTTGDADPEMRNALGDAPIVEPPVPAPEIVNAERHPKRPPDSLDGPPFVTARSWVVADGKTGEPLWGAAEAEPREPASTTKVLTALVVFRIARENPQALDEMVAFSQRADRTGGSTTGLHAGERIPVRELLYGLLLPSGNDAGVALAEHFGGRLAPPAETPDETDPYPRFVAEMNRVAAALGLKETRFANANGLSTRGHRTSARDLARLARYALDDPGLAAYFSTVRHGCTVVAADGGRRNVDWTNTNRLLQIEGYDGVKTGTTEAAGACLVASGRRGDDHLIVVVLGAGSSEARYTETRNLFRWAWRKRGHGEGPPRADRGPNPDLTRP
jgi:D-alanyl-D-alanine carboxypeptidase (penicillin-binding protein 5/6)